MTAYEWVEDYFVVHGQACGECPHMKAEREPHGEVWNRCLLIDPPYPMRADPEDCPAWQREQEDA